MARQSKAERDAAFTAFMTDATPSLLRTAWLLTGSTDRSQELVQAAFVKTYAAWPKVRSESALAYARRVLVNQKTDTWRRTSREVIVGEVPEHEIRPDSNAPSWSSATTRTSPNSRSLTCLGSPSGP